MTRLGGDGQARDAAGADQPAAKKFREFEPPGSQEPPDSQETNHTSSSQPNDYQHESQQQMEQGGEYPYSDYDNVYAEETAAGNGQQQFPFQNFLRAQVFLSFQGYPTIYLSVAILGWTELAKYRILQEEQKTINTSPF